MHKLSDIISKPVYSLYEGQWLGTIIDINFDYRNKKVKGFLVLSSDDENTLFVDRRNIQSLGEGAAILKNVSKLQLNQDANVGIINKEAVSLSGETCGKTKEVFFDDEFNLVAVETSVGIVIPFEKIINVGDDAIFFTIDETKINVKAMKPKVNFSFKNLSNVTVSIMEDVVSKGVTGAELSTIGDIKNENFKANKSFSLPKKIAQNPSFLIGRIAASSIRSDDGEVIVKEGQKITEKSISRAQIHNKIFELSSCAN